MSATVQAVGTCNSMVAFFLCGIGTADELNVLLNSTLHPKPYTLNWNVHACVYRP